MNEKIKYYFYEYSEQPIPDLLFRLHLNSILTDRCRPKKRKLIKTPDLLMMITKGEVDDEETISKEVSKKIIEGLNHEVDQCRN